MCRHILKTEDLTTLKLHISFAPNTCTLKLLKNNNQENLKCIATGLIVNENHCIHKWNDMVYMQSDTQVSMATNIYIYSCRDNKETFVINLFNPINVIDVYFYSN